jgi:hypothetical protein
LRPAISRAGRVAVCTIDTIFLREEFELGYPDTAPATPLCSLRTIMQNPQTNIGLLMRLAPIRR